MIQKITKKNGEVIEYIRSFNDTLDGAVHGHKNAETNRTNNRSMDKWREIRILFWF